MLPEIYLDILDVYRSPHARSLSRGFSQQTQDQYYQRYKDVPVSQKEMVKVLSTYSHPLVFLDLFGDVNDGAYSTVLNPDLSPSDSFTIGHSTDIRPDDDGELKWMGWDDTEAGLSMVYQQIEYSVYDDLHITYTLYRNRTSLMRINESYARIKVVEKHHANLEKFSLHPIYIQFYLICQCVAIGLSVNKEDTNDMLDAIDTWIETL